MRTPSPHNNTPGQRAVGFTDAPSFYAEFGYVVPDGPPRRAIHGPGRARAEIRPRGEQGERDTFAYDIEEECTGDVYIDTASLATDSESDQ